jgi:hypothetical protein
LGKVNAFEKVVMKKSCHLGLCFQTNLSFYIFSSHNSWFIGDEIPLFVAPEGIDGKQKLILLFGMWAVRILPSTQVYVIPLTILWLGLKRFV